MRTLNGNPHPKRPSLAKSGRSKGAGKGTVRTSPYSPSHKPLVKAGRARMTDGKARALTVTLPSGKKTHKIVQPQGKSSLEIRGVAGAKGEVNRVTFDRPFDPTEAELAARPMEAAVKAARSSGALRKAATKRSKLDRPRRRPVTETRVRFY